MPNVFMLFPLIDTEGEALYNPSYHMICTMYMKIR